MTPEMMECYYYVSPETGKSYSDLQEGTFRGDVFRYVTHIRKKRKTL